MARILLLILGALFALVSFAQAEDKIRAYSFPVKSCDGPPQLVNIDIGRNECHNLAVGAQSFRAFKHEQNINWVEDINNGTTTCEFVAYSAHGCIEETALGHASLPQGIQQCLAYSAPDPALSIQFVCRSATFAVTATVTTARTTTSWSFGQDDKPTPHLITKKVTSTMTAIQTLARRAPEPSAAHLEPRKIENNHKGLWMFHPWSLSLICYDCYTYKTDDFTRFDCRSGPKNPIDCGPRPRHRDSSTRTRTLTSTSLLVSPIFTFVPVATTTIYTTPLSTTLLASREHKQETSEDEDEEGDIEKRSWHTRVKFLHPYKLGVEVCADAEWEKRGKPETEIRLQKIGTDMRKCDESPDTKDLNVPKDYIVSASTTVTTPGFSILPTTNTATVVVIPGSNGGLPQTVKIEAVPAHADL